MIIDTRRALAGIAAAFAMFSFSPAASAQAMPTLPDAIKSQGKVRVGVRCDACGRPVALDTRY